MDELGQLTIFVGPNAVGKTNIIEAIQLLTALTSFRHATSAEMIRSMEESARASAFISDGNRQLETALIIDGTTRKYSLNGKAKRTSDLKGLIPSVTFTPDDLMMIKGSDSGRRHALDVLGSQLNPNYYTIMRDFEKVLRHKNKLLKDEAPLDLIDAVNELYIRVASQLTSYRSALFSRLLPHIAQLYSKFSDGAEQLTGNYIPSWKRISGNSNKDELDSDPTLKKASAPEQIKSVAEKSQAIDREESSKMIAESVLSLRDDEVRRKRTLIGPNHDAVKFAIDGMDASSFASQGQQRSIVLAWKLAEAVLIEEMLGQLPVLLLDDVMSELDSSRREALVEHLREDIQVFITTANIDYFDKAMLEKADIIHLPMKTAS